MGAYEHCVDAKPWENATAAGSARANWSLSSVSCAARSEKQADMVASPYVGQYTDVACPGSFFSCFLSEIGCTIYCRLLESWGHRFMCHHTYNLGVQDRRISRFRPAFDKKQTHVVSNQKNKTITHRRDEAREPLTRLPGLLTYHKGHLPFLRSLHRLGTHLCGTRLASALQPIGPWPEVSAHLRSLPECASPETGCVSHTSVRPVLEASSSQRSPPLGAWVLMKSFLHCVLTANAADEHMCNRWGCSRARTADSTIYPGPRAFYHRAHVPALLPTNWKFSPEPLAF